MKFTGVIKKFKELNNRFTALSDEAKRQAAFGAILSATLFYLIVRQITVNSKLEKEKSYVIGRVFSFSNGKNAGFNIRYFVNGKEYKTRVSVMNEIRISTGDNVFLKIVKSDPEICELQNMNLNLCPDVSTFMDSVFHELPDNLDVFCSAAQEKEFAEFAGEFKSKELKDSIKFSVVDLPNFAETLPIEISREKAIKYLCGGDDKKAIQSTGKYYTYFCGPRVQFKKDLSGLIYYSVSSDWNGYILAIFDKQGKLKDTLFLSGTKGLVNPEAKKNAIIFHDGKIVITEMIFLNKMESSKPFKGDYLYNTFQVTDDGSIRSIEIATHTK